MLISHPTIKCLVTSISFGSTMWMSGKWDGQHFFTSFSRGGENWGLGTCTDTATQHSYSTQILNTAGSSRLYRHCRLCWWDKTMLLKQKCALLCTQYGGYSVSSRAGTILYFAIDILHPKYCNNILTYCDTTYSKLKGRLEWGMHEGGHYCHAAIHHYLYG